MVLQKSARLLEKTIDLDKSTFENIQIQIGSSNDLARKRLGGQIETMSRDINVAFEIIDLKPIEKLLMQCSKICIAEKCSKRTLSCFHQWNKDIFEWQRKL